MTPVIVLYLIAAVMFALAAIGVSSRVKLLEVGLLAWVLVPTLHAIGWA